MDQDAKGATRKSAVRTVLRILSYARPYKGLIILSLVIMAVYAAIYQGRVLLVKPLFDEALTKENWEKLSFLALLVLGLALPIGLFDYLQNYLSRFILFRLIVDLRARICEHLMGLSIRFFNERRAGDLLSRILNDVTGFQKAIDITFGDAILSPLMLLAAIGSAFILNWRLSLLCLLMFPLFIWPLSRLGRKIRRSKGKMLVKLGDVTESVHQIFTGIRVVKAFKMEKEEMEEFRRRNESLMKKLLGVVKAKALSSALIEVLQAAAMAIPFLVGGYFVVKGIWGMTAGALVGIMLALVAAARPMKTLIKAYNSFQEAIPAGERIFELLDAEPEITEAPDAVPLDGIGDGVRFSGVSFSYDTEPVLKELDFHVRPGEQIALVGPSGAGKSTLMDLIARFYDPQAGTITIGGLDLRKLRRDSLIAKLAVVTQDTFLFNATIEENIRYGRREATAEEIREAARAAYIHEHIASLPQGYASIVGERGVKLSAGQRQRLCIARALLKDPQLLLLDEATSALDTESEKAVQAALENLMRGRTTFVIAHRLSTIQNCDRIFVLDLGRLVEVGSHQELLQRRGLYERLWRMQWEETPNPPADR